MRLKWSKAEENLEKITRLNSQNLVFLCFQTSIFRHYCIQDVKDGIQIQVYNINNESVNHFSHFISEEEIKNLRKSQAQCWEKLIELRLRQNYGFLKKTTCTQRDDESNIWTK